ncbi:GNAT family N-acetyltransferase [Microbacterium sp.]|uniref:GNAT family N-acetyltransferase n=1 Tax=Microbacterium sp. TaxID=51671 RepID=UPI003F95D1FD
MTEAASSHWQKVTGRDERTARIAAAATRVVTRRAAAGVRSAAPSQTDAGELWICEDPALAIWLFPGDPRMILADVDDESIDPQRLLSALSDLLDQSGSPRVMDFSEYTGDAVAAGLAEASGARRTATKMQIDVARAPEAAGISLRPMEDAEFTAYQDTARHAFAQDWLDSGLAADLDEALRVADEQMGELLPDGLHTAGNKLFTVRVELGERVGVLWLHIDDHRAFIYDIEMEPFARGRGYGTQTLRAAAAETRAAGGEVLALNVFGSNEAARRLYTREGYRTTEILWSAEIPVAPSQTFEIERKYDVDVDTALPVWAEIPGVTAVTDGELRVLDARYFDTADAALSKAGVAVRRRTGGPDAGWHIKGPREGDGRIEMGWPLDADDTIPDAVTEALTRWTTAQLMPLARIENDRTAYLLTGEDGIVAEFVDDHVRATDLRQGAEREWREWEVELGPAAPADEAGRDALFTAVEVVVFAAGARPAATDSKLARALGY